MPKRTNKDAGLSPRDGKGIRARISFKGHNFEKVVPNKEQGKLWRAQMLTDLARCPKGIESRRNQWIVKIDTGTKIIESKFNHLDDAIDWQLSTKSALQHGIYQSDAEANLTLNHFIKTWRKSKVRASARTMQRYDSSLNNQILPRLGDLKLRDISTNRIREWVGEMVIDKVGPSEIDKSLALLRQVLGLAFDSEVIRRNPVVKIETPKVISKEQRALTLQELEGLSDSCGSLKAFVLTMGLMGLRIGEACALQVRDVNLFQKTLTVRSGFTHDENYKRVLSTTKTDEIRHIPIPVGLIPLLRPLLEEKKSKDFVFLGKRGGPINDGYFRKAFFGPAVRAMKLVDITVHNLRHTCASQLISSGAPITTVSYIMGHSSVVQTLDTYGHYYTKDVEATMRNLSDNFETLRGSKGDLKIA
jgi:integrase